MKQTSKGPVRLAFVGDKVVEAKKMTRHAAQRRAIKKKMKGR